VKKWVEAAGPLACVQRFVGRNDTNSLTRKAFLDKVQRMLSHPGKVFILYYAGHGTKGDASWKDAKPGAFHMQDGHVNLDDLVNIWAGSQVTARRGQRFVIMADSCYSGALVSRLKEMHSERRQTGLPNLNMAVQSACGHNETSVGGVFTWRFVEQQLGKPQNFCWTSVVPPNTSCQRCHNYFNESCPNCQRMHELGFPRDLDEVQHPDFFTTWGGDSVQVDGFEMKFCRRV